MKLERNEDTNEGCITRRATKIKISIVNDKKLLIDFEERNSIIRGKGRGNGLDIHRIYALYPFRGPYDLRWLLT